MTEFLPISSSGHLVLFAHTGFFADQGQTIDVAAHIGTLAAVMVYLRAEIKLMILGLIGYGHEGQIFEARRLIILLIVASMPVIIVGLIFEFWSPDFLRLAVSVALANLIFAGWLYWADGQEIRYELARGEEEYAWHGLRFWHAFLIGMVQIFALIPGASRSGVTMSMARQLGYDRLVAARFSWLLSIPVIGGAGVVKGWSLGAEADLFSLILVMSLSFIFALIALRLMMGWLAQADFKLFVWYRLGLGILLLGLVASGYLS